MILFAFTILQLGGCGEDEPEAVAEVEAQPSGRWVQKRKGRDRDIEALEAIGYLATAKSEAAAQGVTHRTAQAWDGWNLVTSGHAPEAVLMDMQGRSVHTWSLPIETALPDKSKHILASKTTSRNAHHWRKTHVLPDGDLIAIWGGVAMARMDRDSNLLWAKANRAHHDLDVAPNGTIYVLTRRARRLERIDEEDPVLEDWLFVYHPDGELIARMSLLEAIEHSDYRSFWETVPVKTGDSFHTNAVFFLREQGVHPAFKPGRVLVSMREINAIGVVDLGTKRFEWFHTGDYRAQHDPRITPAGTLLLFDNRGPRRRRSRVLEFDLRRGTPEPIWDYTGTSYLPFFSKECGISQPLPNGNTLITETDNGRAFEVTRDKQTAWEFHTYHRGGDEGDLIAKLFEVERLPFDYFPWLSPE